MKSPIRVALAAVGIFMVLPAAQAQNVQFGIGFNFGTAPCGASPCGSPCASPCGGVVAPGVANTGMWGSIFFGSGGGYVGNPGVAVVNPGVVAGGPGPGYYAAPPPVAIQPQINSAWNQVLGDEPPNMVPIEANGYNGGFEIMSRGYVPTRNGNLQCRMIRMVLRNPNGRPMGQRVQPVVVCRNGSRWQEIPSTAYIPMPNGGMPGQRIPPPTRVPMQNGIPGGGPVIAGPAVRPGVRPNYQAAPPVAPPTATNPPPRRPVYMGQQQQAPEVVPMNTAPAVAR